jgi:hypothetical protein
MSDAKDTSKDVTPDQANASAGNESQENASKTETAAQVNERLLRESKEYKQKYLETKRALEGREKAEQEEKGRFKELYEAERQKNEQIRKMMVKSSVERSVAEHAVKAGCVNLEDLLKLGDTKLLQFDEESGTVMGVDLFVEDAKKRKPYLFTASKTPTINPSTPGGVAKDKPLTAMDIAKLPADQKMKLWLEAEMKQKK